MYSNQSSIKSKKLKICISFVLGCAIFCTPLTAFASATQWDTADRNTLNNILSTLTSALKYSNTWLITYVRNIDSNLGSVDTHLDNIDDNIADYKSDIEALRNYIAPQDTTTQGTLRWLLDHAFKKGNNYLIDYTSNIDTNIGSIKNGITSLNTTDSNIYTLLDERITEFVLNNSINRPRWVYRQNGSPKSFNRSFFSSSSFPVLLGYEPTTEGADPSLTLDVDRMNEITSYADMLNLMNTNIATLGMEMFSLRGNYHSYEYDEENNEIDSYTAFSLADFLDVSLGNVVKSTGKLASVLASDDDIQMQEDNKDTVEEVREYFFSPEEDARIDGLKVRAFTSSNDKLRGFTAGGNIDADRSFDVIEEDADTWLFFSSDVKSDIDTTNNPGRLRMLSSPTLSSYDIYLEEVYNAIR